MLHPSAKIWLGHNTWAKSTFYPEIPLILMLQKCEFCLKIEISEMWIFWKMRLQKCKFCENWEFKIVNLVKIEISERWIFVKIGIFNLWLFGQNVDFCPSVHTKSMHLPFAPCQTPEVGAQVSPVFLAHWQPWPVTHCVPAKSLLYPDVWCHCPRLVRTWDHTPDIDTWYAS